MVYKLSDQLDHVGNSKYVFEAYDEYFSENKNKLIFLGNLNGKVWREF